MARRLPGAASPAAAAEAAGAGAPGATADASSGWAASRAGARSLVPGAVWLSSLRTKPTDAMTSAPTPTITKLLRMGTSPIGRYRQAPDPP